MFLGFSFFKMIEIFICHTVGKQLAPTSETIQSLRWKLDASWEEGGGTGKLDEGRKGERGERKKGRRKGEKEDLYIRNTLFPPTHIHSPEQPILTIYSRDSAVMRSCNIVDGGASGICMKKN